MTVLVILSHTSPMMTSNPYICGVTYLVDENVYGLNGHHLGWFVDGVLFNLKGLRVGSIGAKCPYRLYGEPGKYSKHGKYGKYGRYGTYGRPGLSGIYSTQSLEEFLKNGAVGSV